MDVTATAISFTVPDPTASARFLTTHFGFTQTQSAPGFANLTREDVGANVIFLGKGIPTLPEDQRHEVATGVILAFVVEDLEGELARLESEGVAITMPLTVDDWGERSFQVRDPAGVIVQLVDWKG
jgi:uncharacterized glyoxalase superfamily protein PhnB